MNSTEQKERTVADFFTQKAIDDAWGGVSAIADQVGRIIELRKDPDPLTEHIIDLVSTAIETIDDQLANNASIQKRVGDANTFVKSLRVQGVIAAGTATRPENPLREVQEAEASLRFQQRLLLNSRAHLMSIMIKMNPEDAWAWEPDQLAAIRTGRDSAGIGASFYESGDAFLASLDARAN